MEDDKSSKGNSGERLYEKADFVKRIRIKLEQENI